MYYHIAPVAFVHIVMITIVNQQSLVVTEGCDRAFYSETGSLMLTAWSLHDNSQRPKKYSISNSYVQLFKRYRCINVNSV